MPSSKSISSHKYQSVTFLSLCSAFATPQRFVFHVRLKRLWSTKQCKINVIRSDDDDDNDSCEWRREFSSFVLFLFFKVHTCIESESTLYHCWPIRPQ